EDLRELERDREERIEPESAAGQVAAERDAPGVGEDEREAVAGALHRFGPDDARIGEAAGDLVLALEPGIGLPTRVGRGRLDDDAGAVGQADPAVRREAGAGGQAIPPPIARPLET